MYATFERPRDPSSRARGPINVKVLSYLPGPNGIWAVVIDLATGDVFAADLSHLTATADQLEMYRP
jgi:hypothetical protein